MAFNEKWKEVSKKAWEDKAFKQRLIDEPGEILKEFGIEFPKGIRLSVVENESDLIHLVLPSPEAYDGKAADESENTLSEYAAAW